MDTDEDGAFEVISDGEIPSLSQLYLGDTNEMIRGYLRSSKEDESTQTSTVPLVRGIERCAGG